VTRLAVRRLGRCALSGAALLGLTLGTSVGYAAVLPPPDPRVAAATFVAACWHGLRDPARFRRAIRRSPLGFQLMDVSGSTSRYSGPMAIHMTPGRSCVAHLRFFEEADIGRFFEAISRGTGLGAPSAETNPVAPLLRVHRWPEQPASGRRLVLQATVTPPDGHTRPEPQGLRVALSASFVAAE
jgi:hypothetical protein